jgi:aquaporin Z
MAASTVSKLVAEFVGTWLLVFTIGCNVMGQTGLWGGVSIACVLMVSIYTFGGISGANFNPAVSVALGLTKSMGGKDIGMEWPEVGAYCFVQIVAGIVAGCTYLVMFGNSFNLVPAKGYGILSSGACELFYTFMLVFVVLNVAVAKSASTCEKGGNHYYGLAIGFVIVAGAYGAGVISGGCFNPAVAAGVDVSSAHIGIGWFAIYWIFEFVGAALAVSLFKVVRPQEFEGAESDPGMVPALVSEFLGTFMLVLTVGLNVLGHSAAGAFSIAASLMCMIYALGGVSGAHFNPAVTVAILGSGLDEKLTAGKACAYMGTQIVAGVMAAYAYAFIHHAESFPLGPGKGYNWTQVAVAEIAFTFVLCLVVLCVAVSEKTKLKEFYGLAIGSCVTVGGCAIGGISGGSLNPAVSWGIASSQIMNGGMFYKALIYTAFELVGAGLAAGVVKITHADTEPKSFVSAKEDNA